VSTETTILVIIVVSLVIGVLIFADAERNRGVKIIGTACVVALLGLLNLERIEMELRYLTMDEEAFATLKGEALRQDDATAFITQRLEATAVFPILFRDYPEDKERFIREVTDAYLRDGEEGYQQKMIEMPIIMMVNHIHRYAERIPDAEVMAYAHRATRVFDMLHVRDPALCNRFIKFSGHYAQALEVTGMSTFQSFTDSIPAMIVAADRAVKKPKDVRKLARIRREHRLLANAYEQELRSGRSTDRETASCTQALARFKALHQLIPEDAAMLMRDHIGGVSGRSWQLAPR